MIDNELLSVAWYPTRRLDWGVPEDEKKDIVSML